MKTIIALTLMVLSISLYPDAELVEVNMRGPRPVRQPPEPVIRGGLRADLQWPRPWGQRMLMLEAERRDKRRPIDIEIDIDALINVALQTQTSSRREDCATICDREAELGFSMFCGACRRVCLDQCCPEGQAPTPCPSRLPFAFNDVSDSCMSDCLTKTNTCPYRCEACGSCCRRINSLDECRPS